MQRSDPLSASLEVFYDNAWITDVVAMVKSGKEATVYCCRAHRRTGMELLAAKVYRPAEHRLFRNDAIYQEGRVILDKRIRRAVQNKTRAGRGASAALWAGHEFETLALLHNSGVDVPKPITSTHDTILMEYVGDEEMAAPPLRHVSLERDEAHRLFRALIRNLELLLACNCVHGDLSAFNILYWQGKAWIIDLPQAVDPRVNRNAFDLLTRDVENVCVHFSRYGVHTDGYRISRRLWTQWLNGELQ